ncbi:MAG TPA: NADH-quinone oxidoreductase subunit K [Clostridia bacterium]|nr:NADH-quinone oxidoreductase subunit K [Clostridia bacterium]
MNIFFAILIVAVVLVLGVGIYSLVVTRNLLRILLSVEILMKGATLLLIGAGYLTGDMATAQAFVITVIIIEVVLLVVATGIVLGAYRANGTLNTRELNNLKG